MSVAAATASRPTSAGNRRLPNGTPPGSSDGSCCPREPIACRASRRTTAASSKKSDSLPSGPLVDRHRFWLMPEPFAQVSQFVHSRLPRGARLTGTGTSSGPHVPANSPFTISFPALPDRISSRALEVVLVALPITGPVRVDAQDVLDGPRPAGEKVPAAVRVIEVQSRKAHIRVTSAAKVRRLVRLFDSLPIVQPGGIYGCLPDTIHGPRLSLRFLSTRGALLARASVPGSFSADRARRSSSGSKAAARSRSRDDLQTHRAGARRPLRLGDQARHRGHGAPRRARRRSSTRAS